MDAKKRVMRDINLNEPVAIVLPAHIWLCFLAAYNTCDWTDNYASAVMMEVRDALFDPVLVKEQDAAMQAAHTRHDQFHGMVSDLLLGRPPRPPGDMLPPDAGGLEDT